MVCVHGADVATDILAGCVLLVFSSRVIASDVLDYPVRAALFSIHHAHFLCVLPAAKEDVLSTYDASQPRSDTNFDPFEKVSERVRCQLD